MGFLNQKYNFLFIKAIVKITEYTINMKFKKKFPITNAGIVIVIKIK